MSDVQLFQPGNYRFVSHAFQYSGGVEALQGYAIERARFAKPLPLAEGFAEFAVGFAEFADGLSGRGNS